MKQMLSYRTINADWDVFRDSSDGTEEFTTSVTGFINKYIVSRPHSDCTYISKPEAMD
jgi:hypothetical protein